MKYFMKIRNSIADFHKIETYVVSEIVKSYRAHSAIHDYLF